MESKNIDLLLNSGKYRSELENTLTEMLSKMMPSQSESTVSSLFEFHLKHFIKNFFNKDVKFEREVNSKILRHEFVGRIDAISNDLIIEYKKPESLSKENDKAKAITQVEKYILQIKEKTGNELQAILTDGQKICYFYFQNGKVKHSPFNSINTNDFDKIVRALISVDNKKFVPKNLVDDFRLEAVPSITSRLAKCLFDIINEKPSQKTQMLFKEWEELFHLSENDKGKNLDIDKRRKALTEIFGIDITNNDLDYKALFVLQTSYAIIIKLIACKIISKFVFDDEIQYFSDLSVIKSEKLRDFIEKLEDGYVFSVGIRNLLEGDFFSWYAADEQWNDKLFGAMIEIIKTLDGYSNYSFSNYYAAIDIFKDLYMEIMPSAIRHSLGEYFTPSWLADYVVKKSTDMIQHSNWKAIDPCCGSGIFIISLINEIIGDVDISEMNEIDKTFKLNEIITRVSGIDINPLSVLTARVGYLLAVSPFIGSQKFEIPIFLGDSADIPKKECIGDVDCYSYSINTAKGNISIILPCNFVKGNSFVEKMSLLQTKVKAKTPNLLYDQIIDWISSKDLNDEIKNSLIEFSKKLVFLHENKWDGIWVRIVTNFMLVARISDIDIIIGNPPWVKWEFLPQFYAEKIKKICTDRRIFSGQTYMGAISLNICALIANITASTWLKEDGILSFLMPKTLMTQDSYAGFRNFYTNGSNTRLFLQKTDDWTNSGDPFVDTKEKFLTYYYGYNFVDYSKGVSINRITKKRGHNIQNLNKFNKFSDVKKCFEFKKGIAYQLDANRTGFTMVEDVQKEDGELFKTIIGESYYKARSGAEFTPAEVYFVEPVKESGDDKTYLFKNSVFENAVHKTRELGVFELEKSIVHPVIKGPCINEFGIEDSNNYCIFPYEHNNKKSMPLEKLNLLYPYASSYFINNKKLISGQSNRSKMIMQGTAFYSLSKVGIYTFADNIVAFRDNTKLMSAVIEPQLTPWGTSVMPICAKHSPYISMDINGNYITNDEAYYLAGILNTDIIQKYFICTYSGRSYSIKFNIKLPKFNSDSSEHAKISALSKKAHENFKKNIKTDNLKEEIQQIYLKMCEEIDIT